MGMVISEGRALIVVRGVPVPQGSMKAYAVKGKARITTGDTSVLARYRADIRAQVEDWQPGTGAYHLRLVFLFPRPASHWLPVNRKRSDPGLKPLAPTYHAQSPDVDKLARAVLDALTGHVYLDDRQVVSLDCEKRWADDYGSPGWTRIHIEQEQR